jgi:monoterpene epsilon-lactone hydrolase
VKQSIQSKILSKVLKLINFKKIVEMKAFKLQKRSKKIFVPKSIQRKYLTHIERIDTKVIATINYKDNVTNNHLLFLHGGAYIFDISSNHWKLVSNIVDKTYCRMTIIDYPLAPENNYKHTFKMLHNAYDLLLSKYPQDKFLLMGDSSGGGISLAFLQNLIEIKHERIPEKCILLSPWLDMTLSNPDIKDIESRDHILSVKMLKYAAEKYSDGDNMEHYFLSPINGIFNNIPKTIILYGTEEIFYADCKKLENLLSNNSNIIFREYKNMQHDWVLFQIPESRIVIDEICKFIDTHSSYSS